MTLVLSGEVGIKARPPISGKQVADTFTRFTRRTNLAQGAHDKCAKLVLVEGGELMRHDDVQFFSRTSGICSVTDKQMIVFSDLDGSLLDHDNYNWHPAQPALKALRKRGIPLVLVSSKTLAELEDYRAQLELLHPVVAENGAAIFVPAGYFPAAMTLAVGTITRAELQTAYKEVKKAKGFNCEAFYELGLQGIARESGLTVHQAARANDRLASEPILWLDSDARATQFEAIMQARGLRCIRGGRFLHLMGNTDKGAAVRRLLDAYALKWPKSILTSVSLGDGPNDLGMLATTDIAIIIPGKHTHPMVLTTQNRVLRPTASGPVGWNEAMLVLLNEPPFKPLTAHGNGE